MPVAALAGFRNGFPFKPEDQGSTGRPIVRIEQFLNPNVEPARYDGSDVPTRNHIADGDLIFSWSGTLAVGTWDREPAYLNQHLFRVDPRPGIQKGWLRWALIEAIARMTPWMHGSAMTHITRRVLEEVRVPVPPVEVQCRIADYLDTKTARIDTLIDRNRDAALLVRERHLAEIVDTVTGGVKSGPVGPMGTAYWINAERAGWQVAPLGLNYRIQLGKMLNEERGEDPEGRPYLGNANVQWDRFVLGDLNTMTFGDDEWVRYGVEPGDLLVCEGGEVGRAAVWEGARNGVHYQKALHRLRPLKAEAVPRYLMYCFMAAAKTAVFEIGSNKATIDHLTSEKLQEHRFPFPPAVDQRRIVDELDTASVNTSSLLHRLDRQAVLLRERRQALITAAVTGEIEV